MKIASTYRIHSSKLFAKFHTHVTKLSLYGIITRSHPHSMPIRVPGHSPTKPGLSWCVCVCAYLVHRSKARHRRTSVDVWRRPAALGVELHPR